MSAFPDPHVVASPPVHFLALDGLRGVAALAVLVLHLPPLSGLVFHGYLAVDLFFIMSGFVVAHAYERRLLGGWPLEAFIRTRVVRLWPLYLLGTAIGAGVFATVAGDAEGFAALAVLIAAAVFLIPLPLGPDVQVFDLNRPAWSLFFEMVANLVYAASAARLTNRVLAIVAAIGAAALAVCVLTAGTGSLGHHGASMAGGAARIAFGFPVGVLLYRAHCAGRLRLRVPAPLLFGLFLALLALPDLNGWNGAVDLVVVVAAFPVLVAAGATARVSERTGRFCVFVAALSYPLYILHGPILMGFGQLFGETPGPVLTGGVISLLAAWIAGRWYDAPARAALANLLARRRPAPEAAT